MKIEDFLNIASMYHNVEIKEKGGGALLSPARSTKI
jgi:hypothetical protein